MSSDCPAIVNPLEPLAQSGAQWNRHYRSRVAASQDRVPVAVGLKRGEQFVARVDTHVFGAGTPESADNHRYLERMAKSMLWIHGGNQLVIAGADDIADSLRSAYAPGGERAFDADMLGRQIYRQPFSVEKCALDELSQVSDESVGDSGRHTKGFRIGFDLGGSDRKAAAVIDGEVVYSEEIAWDPYFQSDPRYHFDGIRDSLTRAAKHLPQVDAIGGSAAGVYVANEVRAGSLFRGVAEPDFESKVRRIFFDVMASMGWQDKPWRVVNDGEVTALAGSMAIGGNSLLGVSLGTSFAAGYVTPKGRLSSGLNELAFVPVDYREQGPLDEWSGDGGCGVQFFSQQGVARLAQIAGIPFDDTIPFPERLLAIQKLVENRDQRAESIFQSIGVSFGNAIAQFSEWYQLEHLLILGRVTSGRGGEIILESARRVLDHDFADVSEAVAFHIPDEKQKRHGQAIAAASLAPNLER